MFDLIGTILNGISILALAAMLSVLSFAWYTSRMRGSRLLGVLKAPLYQSFFLIAGGILFLGRAAVSKTWGSALGWAMLTAWFLYQELNSFRR